MTITELKDKWTSLSESHLTIGYRSLRISPDCICELYLGVSFEGKRCLILALPSSKHLEFRGIFKEHISIEYFEKNNLIVLQLSEIEFYDLFDDLVLSLYDGIKNISHVDDYANYFIQTFYRWSDFFEDKKSDLLSEDAIKGIMGELLVLKHLISSQSRPEINSLLNSWTGPYDRGNDFELDDKNIEVKTKSLSAVEVKISSEFQLEVAKGKGLELYVVSLQSDFTLGIHIRDLILEIKKVVLHSSGDMAILWKALSQKNITAKNMNQYDRYKFQPIDWISYNCADKKFPKLSTSNIPEGISGVKYTLRTSQLKSFIIAQRSF